MIIGPNQIFRMKLRECTKIKGTIIKPMKKHHHVAI